ncbi:MAG: metallophosphoesterase family protein, partial [Candidatus Helarchaeota archaeon]
MRVGVLSDLHIGAPQSNWHDAAALIQSIAPELDAIVLSGDITEELNPYPKTRALMNHNLNSLKLRIRQELNRFVEMISENISKILFLRGNHDDRLLNQCPLVEDYAV